MSATAGAAGATGAVVWRGRATGGDAGRRSTAGAARSGGGSKAADTVGTRPSPPAPTGASPPRFLERLPAKLRGAELYAVEAQDHYLRLHTSRG
ncbi:MAG: hypothetical protein ACK4GB_06940, partial [Tepidimonas sp.]